MRKFQKMQKFLHHIWRAILPRQQNNSYFSWTFLHEKMYAPANCKLDTWMIDHFAGKHKREGTENWQQQQQRKMLIAELVSYISHTLPSTTSTTFNYFHSYSLGKFFLCCMLAWIIKLWASAWKWEKGEKNEKPAVSVKIH